MSRLYYDRAPRYDRNSSLLIKKKEIMKFDFSSTLKISDLISVHLLAALNTQRLPQLRFSQYQIEGGSIPPFEDTKAASRNQININQ